jgi:Ni/Fe-hydrogenase subunit HybB-like protein
VVEKCNFCAERLAVGKIPACVEAAKDNALIFGDLADERSEIRKVFRRITTAFGAKTTWAPAPACTTWCEVNMLEKAISGSKNYWTWLCALGVIMIGRFHATWLYQYDNGLMITGMSRDVTWGFYIAQFTFLVGVAASAVMLVIPYYLHHYKTFGRIVILGEFLAIASVTMCLLFMLVDMGKPERALNVILHPTPGSILFWDMVVLNGYLMLNAVIGWTTLQSERMGIKPPAWVKPLIYLSIPWAVSIHTVTAFLYCGLPGRGFWLTAILAPPLFGLGLCGSDPAVLILLALLVRKKS